MRFTKNWIKAVAVRTLYTMVQTAIPVFTATTITKTDIRVGIVTTLGAGVLVVLSCLKRELPEVEIEPDLSVSPEIEGEEIIDTSKEDAKLNGGGLNE